MCLLVSGCYFFLFSVVSFLVFSSVKWLHSSTRQYSREQHGLLEDITCSTGRGCVVLCLRKGDNMLWCVWYNSIVASVCVVELL